MPAAGIELRLRRSRLAVALAVAALAVAVGAIVETARLSGTALPLLALPWVMALGGVASRDLVAPGVHVLRIATPGWQVVLADGRLLAASLAGSAFVTPWVVVVPLRVDTVGVCELSVFRDALDDSDYRRLARAARGCAG